MAVSAIFVQTNYLREHALLLIHTRNCKQTILLYSECTKRRVMGGLDPLFFRDNLSLYFLLAFYFRILILYTTDFNPTINKDIINIFKSKPKRFSNFKEFRNDITDQKLVSSIGRHNIANYLFYFLCFFNISNLYRFLLLFSPKTIHTLRAEEKLIYSELKLECIISSYKLSLILFTNIQFENKVFSVLQYVFNYNLFYVSIITFDGSRQKTEHMPCVQRQKKRSVDSLREKRRVP